MKQIAIGAVYALLVALIQVTLDAMHGWTGSVYGPINVFGVVWIGFVVGWQTRGSAL